MAFNVLCYIVEITLLHSSYFFQDPTPAGAVILTNYTVTRAVEANKRFAFKLAKGGARTYYFAANSEEEMRKLVIVRFCIFQKKEVNPYPF